MLDNDTLKQSKYLAACI